MRHRHKLTDGQALEALWESGPAGESVFRPEQVTDRPQAVRRYLEHTIAPGTRLASAVRLRMHGEIKLRGWLPFQAEQVISWDRGMIWMATVRMHGLPIRGSDRLMDGVGAMHWRLFGLLPVMTSAGPDLTRSAIGRVQAESVWLPSVLAREGVAWSASDSSHMEAVLMVNDAAAQVALTVDGAGRLGAVQLSRWGNPEGAGFRAVDFGGVVEQEGTFCGYTIPTRLRIGWHFGTDRFESEGEFFRVTVDDASYR